MAEEALQEVCTVPGGPEPRPHDSGKAPKAVAPGSQEEEEVLLRIEFISKRQGAILQWVVFALTLVLIGITFAVFITKLTHEGSDGVLFGDKDWCAAWRRALRRPRVSVNTAAAPQVRRQPGPRRPHPRRPLRHRAALLWADAPPRGAAQGLDAAAPRARARRGRAAGPAARQHHLLGGALRAGRGPDLRLVRTRHQVVFLCSLDLL